MQCQMRRVAMLLVCLCGLGVVPGLVQAQVCVLPEDLKIAMAYQGIGIARDEWLQYTHWHKAHPVSDEERLRNDLIEQAQGTRNPLIDSPARMGVLLSACRRP